MHRPGSDDTAAANKTPRSPDLARNQNRLHSTRRALTAVPVSGGSVWRQSEHRRPHETRVMHSWPDQPDTGLTASPVATPGRWLSPPTHRSSPYRLGRSSTYRLNHPKLSLTTPTIRDTCHGLEVGTAQPAGGSHTAGRCHPHVTRQAPVLEVHTQPADAIPP